MPTNFKGTPNPRGLASQVWAKLSGSPDDSNWVDSGSSPGPPGPTGPVGPPGPIGLTGPIGPTGLTGLTGSTGVTGATGTPGTNGTNGTPGATGATGPAGIQGAQGITGPIGLTGAQGPTGPQGPPGPGGGGGSTGIDNPSIFNGVFGPNALNADYEFDATSSALPTGWSWVNQGVAVYSEQLGGGSISIVGNATSSVRAIVESLPVASTYTIYAKMDLAFLRQTVGGNPIGGGILLRESSSGKLVTHIHYVNDGVTDWQDYVDSWSSPTTAVSNFQTVKSAFQSIPYYFAITKNSPTSWDFFFGNGFQFVRFATAVNVGAFMTPDQVGFCGRLGNNADCSVAIEWLRIR